MVSLTIKTECTIENHKCVKLKTKLQEQLGSHTFHKESKLHFNTAIRILLTESYISHSLVNCSMADFMVFIADLPLGQTTRLALSKIISKVTVLVITYEVLMKHEAHLCAFVCDMLICGKQCERACGILLFLTGRGWLGI